MENWQRGTIYQRSNERNETMNNTHWIGKPVTFKMSMHRLKKLGEVRTAMQNKNTNWEDWMALAENYKAMGAMANAESARRRASYLKNSNV